MSVLCHERTCAIDAVQSKTSKHGEFLVAGGKSFMACANLFCEAGDGGIVEEGAG